MRDKLVFRLVLTLIFLCSLLGACGKDQGTQPTEVPITETQSTKETDAPMEIMQKNDPAQDDTLNILMIGSSFCRSAHIRPSLTETWNNTNII